MFRQAADQLLHLRRTRARLRFRKDEPDLGGLARLQPLRPDGRQVEDLQLQEVDLRRFFVKSWLVDEREGGAVAEWSKAHH